jgi:hypothetical protein
MTALRNMCLCGPRFNRKTREIARYFDEFESRGNISSIMLSVRADKTSF